MGNISEATKYLLLFFNFLVGACGVVLILFGSIILVDENKGIDRFTDFSVGGFAVAVGLIIFATACFGFYGALKDNICILTTYTIVLIGLLILQIVLGATSLLALGSDVDKDSEKVVMEVFEDYWNNLTDEHEKEVVDNIQQYFKCCGLRGYQEWDLHGGIPKSCYQDEKRSLKNLFKTGCVSTFKETITFYIKLIGGIAVGFTGIEVLLIIITSITMFRSRRENKS